MGEQAQIDYDIKERIVTRLHERVGICGHCGKKKCAGKNGNSWLPQKMNVEDVLWAIDLDNRAV